jgi:hypothetical protein
MLIENWKRAGKMYSVQLAIAIFALGIIQVKILPQYGAQLDPDTYGMINSLLAAVLGLARMVKQGPSAVPGLDDSDNGEDEQPPK